MNNTPKDNIEDVKKEEELNDNNDVKDNEIEDDKVEEKDINNDLGDNITKGDEENKESKKDESADKKNEEKLFTQTEVNEIIKKRLKDRNNPLENELEELKNTVESMKAETERIAQEKRSLKIQSLLKDNNVREDRIDSLIKLKNLDEIDEDNLENAILESIEEFPEFVRNGDSKGSGFRISTDPTEGSPIMTLKEFNALSYKERMRIKKEQPHVFNKIMNK